MCECLKLTKLDGANREILMHSVGGCVFIVAGLFCLFKILFFTIFTGFLMLFNYLNYSQIHQKYVVFFFVVVGDEEIFAIIFFCSVKEGSLVFFRTFHYTKLTRSLGCRQMGEKGF